MKRLLVPILLISLFVISGCEIIKTNSIGDIIANREQLKDQEIVVRGTIIFKSECPPCPPGAWCKPCSPNNIVLADTMKEVTGKDEITVMFMDPNSQVFNDLKVGDQTTMIILVSPEYMGVSGVQNQYGTFIFKEMA